MYRSYVYKLNPNKAQAEWFNQSFGNARFIYNWALDLKSTTYKQDKKNLTAFDIMKELTKLKKEEGKERLSIGLNQSLQCAIVDMDKAYKNFFKGAGFPKYKTRKSRNSIRIPAGIEIDCLKSKVFIPKIKWINYHTDRPLEGEIRQATVIKRPSGYYISIMCKVPDKKQDSRGEVGIDLGLKDFIVTSGGEKVNHPKIFNQSQKLLAKKQRHLSRQVKGSKRYIKTCKEIAKLHEYIANQRKDFLHKLSTSIAKRYDTAYVEDLNVKGMMQNRCLSKAIGDSGRGMFAMMLKYKCNNVVEIGRFEPSSKMCSNCGHIYGELKLSERERTCKKCEMKHDRDLNAAINIKNLGAGALLANAKTSQ